MIWWTISWTLTSLLLILLIHYIYNYMKDTLTTPIVENIANKNKQRYDDMLAPVNIETVSKQHLDIVDSNVVDSNVVDDTSMKDELQSFLNELKLKQDEP